MSAPLAPGLPAPQMEMSSRSAEMSSRSAADGAAPDAISSDRRIGSPVGSPVELARASGKRRCGTWVDRLASPKHPRPIVVAQSIKPRDGVVQVRTGRGVRIYMYMYMYMYMHMHMYMYMHMHMYMHMYMYIYIHIA